MSEYLGWRERKPPREYDTSRNDRHEVPGGPISQDFESYVRNVFRPEAANKGEFDSPKTIADGGLERHYKPVPNYDQFTGSSSHNTNYGQESSTPKVSASAMLKLEQEFGKHALDDSNDAQFVEKSPLEKLYDDLGLLGIEQKNYKNYQSSGNSWQVYNPKSSGEYYGTRAGTGESYKPMVYQPKFISRKDREERNDWRTTDRQFLVDYKDFNSSPLSPYMYQDHPYVHSQDSRIVGSNFVQLTTRPRDRFLEKIDKTLADIRATPRY
uniref:Zasp-like motif domain-containing protein n=1 Tax=Panagrellus redivivus TaxID=6233 RepID=A0A7E4UZQ8_PANRE